MPNVTANVMAYSNACEYTRLARTYRAIVAGGLGVASGAEGKVLSLH